MTYSGLADIGECLSVAAKIREGDFESWYREWYALARHLQDTGDSCLARGHNVSAREAYYRASTYYRTAEFYLHGNPADPRIVDAWNRSRDTFVAAAMMDTFVLEPVEIPYENTTLPGYFYSADRTGVPRPLLIVQTGFDGTQEELYPYAVEGLKRGYNVLTFEGPGQGRVIRVQHIPFRADWEKVVTPVIDYAVSRPDVDGSRIALWGISLGGYFAPRAAAYDHRIAALIADGGVYDPGMSYAILMSYDPEYQNRTSPVTHQELRDYIEKNRFYVDEGMYQAMNGSIKIRWVQEHGMYTFGAATPSDYILKFLDLSMESSAGRIRCPTLICDSESDTLLGGQAKQLYDRLECRKEYMLFSDDYGAGYHCQMGAFATSFQRKFDWLDETMASLGPES